MVACVYYFNYATCKSYKNVILRVLSTIIGYYRLLPTATMVTLVTEVVINVLTYSCNVTLIVVPF